MWLQLPSLSRVYSRRVSPGHGAKTLREYALSCKTSPVHASTHGETDASEPCKCHFAGHAPVRDAVDFKPRPFGRGFLV